MEYFFYCRGRSGTEALVEELAEAHWSFIDRYAEQMTARGPTLTPDRTTWTGSMPSFGDAPLAAISQRDVRAWVAELSARGLAPATVQKAYQLLGKVMGGRWMRGCWPSRRAGASRCPRWSGRRCGS